MSEPTPLGRIVAAERNATTGLDLAKQSKAEMAELRDRLTRLERDLIQVQQSNGMLSARMAALMGSGATQRG